MIFSYICITLYPKKSNFHLCDDDALSAFFVNKWY